MLDRMAGRLHSHYTQAFVAQVDFCIVPQCQGAARKLVHIFRTGIVRNKL
jgi:hypothetical protein